MRMNFILPFSGATALFQLQSIVKTALLPAIAARTKPGAPPYGAVRYLLFHSQAMLMHCGSYSNGCILSLPSTRLRGR